MKERRIAVIGAPESLDFRGGGGSQNRSWRTRLRQAVACRSGSEDREIGRKRREVHFDGLLRQQAEVLFLIGSRLLKPVRRHQLRCRLFLHAGRSGGRWLGPKPRSTRRQHDRDDVDFPELSANASSSSKKSHPRCAASSPSMIREPLPPDRESWQHATGRAKSRLNACRVGGPRTRRAAARSRGAAPAAYDFFPIPGGFASGFYDEITRLTNAKRIPASYHARMGSTADALASYGASDALDRPLGRTTVI